MSMRNDRIRSARQAGISLVELVMFIVVVSVGLVGILSVMNVTTKNSADPMIRKQALAIAESLLEEVELQAFTWCFPSDPKYADPTPPSSSAGCSTGMSEDVLPGGARVSASGAREGQNVSDYRNLALNPIRDVNGNGVAELAGYQASVAVSQVAFTDVGSANDTLKIDVTVTGPSDTSITLTGYRMRYAPNALP